MYSIEYRHSLCVGMIRLNQCMWTHCEEFLLESCSLFESFLHAVWCLRKCRFLTFSISHSSCPWLLSSCYMCNSNLSVISVWGEVKWNGRFRQSVCFLLTLNRLHTVNIIPKNTCPSLQCAAHLNCAALPGRNRPRSLHFKPNCQYLGVGDRWY